MLLFYVLLIVAIMAVAAPLLTKGTVALMGRIAGRTIFQIHSSAQHIMERRTVPDAWRERLARRLDGIRPDAADEGRMALHREKARRACLRELDRLIMHFRKTSIVADEEARHILLTELVRVYEEWESSDWDRMVSRRSGAVQDPALPDA